MDKRRYKRQKIYIFINCFLVIIGLFGAYLIWKDFTEKATIFWVGILLVLIIYYIEQFVYPYSSRKCPQCKSKCFPFYEQMEDDRETWVQRQYPCKKCNIIWCTKDRINVNEKDFSTQSKGAV